MKTRPVRTKMLTILVTLCMVLPLVPGSAYAADSTVQNASELEIALENTDCAEIKLGGNIEIDQELDVKRTVTLDLNGYTLSCSSTDVGRILRTFKIKKNVEVTDNGKIII